MAHAEGGGRRARRQRPRGKGAERRRGEGAKKRLYNACLLWAHAEVGKGKETSQINGKNNQGGIGRDLSTIKGWAQGPPRDAFMKSRGIADRARPSVRQKSANRAHSKLVGVSSNPLGDWPAGKGRMLPA